MLEAALNRVLALDAQGSARMAALEGRRIGVELRGANLALSISVRNGKLCVGPHQADGDLNVRATPASFLAMALRRGDEATPGVGKVEISGDAELARRMERLAREFRPDFEEAFARVFGDIAGVALARAFAGAFAYARASGQALVQDSAEYLREESRDLIAPAEMEQFLDDVDGLRERADRLQARLRRVTVRKDAG